MRPITGTGTTSSISGKRSSNSAGVVGRFVGAHADSRDQAAQARGVVDELVSPLDRRRGMPLAAANLLSRPARP
jgi:hypothetical protein